MIVVILRDNFCVIASGLNYLFIVLRGLHKNGNVVCYFPRNNWYPILLSCGLLMH